MKIKKIKNAISILFNPRKAFLYFCSIGVFHCSDKKYLSMLYYDKFGVILNLDNPKSFNEKLQWLKLNDRKASYSSLVDKYEAKKIVSNIVGEEYIIPTIGVYNNFDDIDFDKLPNKFVIKCTHDSGRVIIINDKRLISKKKIRSEINKSLKKNYYYVSREWPYKNVKPRIIVEKNMLVEKKNLNDYKFFCFNGKCKFILVCTDRDTELKESFYDTTWTELPFKRPNHEKCGKVDKPGNLDIMISISEKLSKEIPFVRVDLYDISGSIFFGEMTFYPAGGLDGFDPHIWDKKIGDMLDLSMVKKYEK